MLVCGEHDADGLALGGGTASALLSDANRCFHKEDLSANGLQKLLSFPASTGEPPRLLRGFERVSLAQGASRTVAIELGPRQLACWDATPHARYVATGSYGIAVGGSSRDLPLRATVQIAGFGPRN